MSTYHRLLRTGCNLAPRPRVRQAQRKCGFSGALLAQVSPETHGCVIADLRMPGVSGLDLQDALGKSRRTLPVLFLTGQGHIASSVRTMRHGAEDFLEKRASQSELLDAVNRALARDAREHAERARLQALRATFDALSPREREVLAHILSGQSNKQIAAELGIHERTLKLHRTAITTKLGVYSVAELTRLAQEAGWFGTGATMSLPAEKVVAEAVLLALHSPANRLGVMVTAATRPATEKMRFNLMFMYLICSVFQFFPFNRRLSTAERAEQSYNFCVMSNMCRNISLELGKHRLCVYYKAKRDFFTCVVVPVVYVLYKICLTRNTPFSW
jgi:FixJ family two-component response regulator